MINWLTRWFKGERAAAPAPPRALTPAAQVAARAPAAPVSAASSPPAQTSSAPPPPVLPDLSLLFYRSLAGAPSAEVPAATEQLILDEFARLVAHPNDGANLVPRVPAVIPQLLKSLRDESMSGAELSRQLAQDVVLVAEVIREANSPYYSPNAPVRTIEGAVMLLGQNGMRMLLARVAFRPIINMQTGRFAQQGAPIVWRQSEACALAASLLAPHARANVFEAYLAGLLHNVGLIVALRLADQIYNGASLPRSAHFAAALLGDARRLSARIAALWEFPPAVVAAIEAAGAQLHGAIGLAPLPSSLSPLALVLACADRLAMLRLLIDGGQLDGATASALTAALAGGGVEQSVFEQLAAHARASA